MAINVHQGPGKAGIGATLQRHKRGSLIAQYKRRTLTVGAAIRNRTSYQPSKDMQDERKSTSAIDQPFNPDDFYNDPSRPFSSIIDARPGPIIKPKLPYDIDDFNPEPSVNETTKPDLLAELGKMQEDGPVRPSGSPSEPTLAAPCDQQLSDAAQASSNDAESFSSLSENDAETYVSIPSSLQYHEEKHQLDYHYPHVDYEREEEEETEEEEQTEELHYGRRKVNDLAAYHKAYNGFFHASRIEIGADEEEKEMNDPWRDERGRRDETPEYFKFNVSYYPSATEEEANEAKEDPLKDYREYSVDILGSPIGAPARFLAHRDPEKYDHVDQGTESESCASTTLKSPKSRSRIGTDTDEDDDVTSSVTFKSRGCRQDPSASVTYNFVSDIERDQLRLAKSESVLLQEALNASMEGHGTTIEEEEPVMDVLLPQNMQNQHLLGESEYRRNARQCQVEQRCRRRQASVDSVEWERRANGYNQHGGIGGTPLNFKTDSIFYKAQSNHDMPKERWVSGAERSRFFAATQGLHPHTESQDSSEYLSPRLTPLPGINIADADLISEAVDPALLDPPLNEVSYLNRLPNEEVEVLYDTVHHLSPLRKAVGDKGTWTSQDTQIGNDDTLMMDILMDIREQRELYHQALPSICFTDGNEDSLIRLIRQGIIGPDNITKPMDIQIDEVPAIQT